MIWNPSSCVLLTDDASACGLLVAFTGMKEHDCTCAFLIPGNPALAVSECSLSRGWPSLGGEPLGLPAKEHHDPRIQLESIKRIISILGIGICFLYESRLNSALKFMQACETQTLGPFKWIYSRDVMTIIHSNTIKYCSTCFLGNIPVITTSLGLPLQSGYQ